MEIEPSINWKDFYEKEAEFKRFIPEEDYFEIYRTDNVMSIMPETRLESALDVGCGDGYLCSLYKGLGISHVEGCDFSEKRIEYASKAFADCRFSKEDIYNLSYADGAFDLVSSVQVVEHLERPQDAIRELGRVSKRYVLITVPYDQKLTKVACPHCLELFHLDGHIQSFDVARLADICTSSGLKVVKTAKYNPFFKKMSIRWIPSPILDLLKRNILKKQVESSMFLGILCEKEKAT